MKAVSIRGLKCSPLSNTESAETRVIKFCHTVEWKPDIDLLKSDMIPNVALSTPEDVKYRRHEVQDLQLTTMLMIMDTLDELKDVPGDSYEGYSKTTTSGYYSNRGSSNQIPCLTCH